jgi:hypothetical protein
MDCRVADAPRNDGVGLSYLDLICSKLANGETADARATNSNKKIRVTTTQLLARRRI